MLSIELPADLENRLEALADKSGRTKTQWATEAIRRLLEDAEDVEVVAQRIRDPAKRWSLEDLELARDLEG
jgi:RHH-type transcriptional regulator, rel operon repressor / antitoxin RelB